LTGILTLIVARQRLLRQRAPGLQIRNKHSLAAILSLVRRSEPNCNYEIRVIDGSTQRQPLPPLTDQELALAEFHKRPASPLTIIDHLKRCRCISGWIVTTPTAMLSSLQISRTDWMG
jgi:hypothetical protein